MKTGCHFSDRVTEVECLLVYHNLRKKREKHTAKLILVPNHGSGNPEICKNTYVAHLTPGKIIA
jgi:hypothetical protein